MIFRLTLVVWLALCSAANAQLSGGLQFPGPGTAHSASGCSQATAFLARTSGLDATHQTAYTTLICGLVTDGVFSKFDALWISATQDLVTAKLNLVSTSFALTGAGVPTFTFTADRGIAGDGSGNGNVSTNFDPSTAGGNYVLNSAHIMVWSNTLGNSSGGDFGAAASSNSFFITNSAATGSQSQVNAAGNTTENTSSGKGFYLASRTASNNINNYWGLSGTLTTLSSTSSASTSLTNTTFGFNNVVGFSTSTKQISAASVGTQLSGTDATNLYSRLQAYMTAVGN